MEAASFSALPNAEVVDVLLFAFIPFTVALKYYRGVLSSVSFFREIRQKLEHMSREVCISSRKHSPPTKHM